MFIYRLNSCFLRKVKVKSLSCVWLFATHGHQPPPSMGFSRREYWSGLPFPSPGRERERESFLLVIFELERVHVYLAQAINLNLPESFALNVNARNSTHTWPFQFRDSWLWSRKLKVMERKGTSWKSSKRSPAWELLKPLWLGESGVGWMEGLLPADLSKHKSLDEIPKDL